MYMLLSNRDYPISIYHTYQDLVNAGSTLLYIGTTHKSQQLIAVKLGDYHAISGGVMHWQYIVLCKQTIPFWLLVLIIC